MTETVTYRLVREWLCPICGILNSTFEYDVEEDGCAVCVGCTGEFIYFIEEEVE